jgi:hypothetical protein
MHISVKANYDQVSQQLTALIGKENWFLGGSQRFGYYSADSDLDFFCLIEGAKGLAVLANKMVLETVGGKLNSPDYPGLHLKSSKSPVERYDIIVMSNLLKFTLLRLQHDEVEAYLEKNPEVIKLLQYRLISGKQKYRMVAERAEELRLISQLKESIV